jgi:heavy metal efflux system protein
MTTDASGPTARLMRAAFARPLVAVVLVLGGCGLGLVSFLELRRDVFPDLSAPVFNVIVQNPAMGAEELESGIAVPLEAALAGMPDVRRIRSSSQLGVCQVTVEFEPDAAYTLARQLVAERVAQAAAQLPPGTDLPLVSSLTGRLNEIYEFTLEAEPGAADLMALRDLAEFDVRNRLLAVRGVAAVEVLGGHLRQFQVQLDPDRLAARAVSLEEVRHALEGASANAAGGFVVQGSTEWAVRAVGRAGGVDDLRRTVVAVRAATPVLLGDVAEVREGAAVRRGLAHRLQGEVVSARIVKQFGADTVVVAQGIAEAVKGLRSALPKGVVLRTVYDQSELVRSALGGVTRAVLVGAVLVVAVLFLLLGDARAAFIVTLTIPLSLALAGLALRRLDVGLNTMTLGGLAIAVGLLVDAAIIVTENIVHRLRGASFEPGARAERALEAAVEVGRPITFATLIVAAVFLPLFGMGGLEGRMYRPLAAAVVATVAASLALALTLVPLAAAFLLRPRAPAAPEDVWLVRRVKAVYAPLLRGAMRHAGAVRVGTLLVTVPALAAAALIGRDFMPRLDEGAFLLQTLLPPEASLAQVDAANHRVEDVLRAFPEVEDVVRRTGRAERTEDPMPHTVSDVLVVLKPGRRRSLDDLEEAMRAELAHVPAVSVLFTTPLGMRIDEGLGGTPADLAVRIFGPDLEVLARLGDRARDLMAGIAGIADLRVEQGGSVPHLRIVVDRDAAARVGLTPGEIVQGVRVGLVGEEFAPLWVGQRRFDLVLHAQDDRRRDAAAIRALLLDGHDGTKVPLGQVARLEEAFGPAVVRREAGSRRIAVEAGVAGRDLGRTAGEVRRRLEKGLALPTGYFLDVGGRVESQGRATRALLVSVAIAVLAVFILLYLALGSAAEALVILATLPDAFVGGILALLVAGETWNVSSLVGLIGLFGIAVQNGLVLVTQTRALVAEGRPFAQALEEASIARVRPKLMTAGCAILGLLPLLLLRLHGTELERPLAIVMIGGLLTSTVFTLLALPTLYTLVHGWQERRALSRKRLTGNRSEA